MKKFIEYLKLDESPGDTDEYKEIKTHVEKNKTLIKLIEDTLKKNKIKVGKPPFVGITNNRNIFYILETAVTPKGISHKNIAKFITDVTKGETYPGGYSNSVKVSIKDTYLEIFKNRAGKIEIQFKIGDKFSWIK